MDNDLKFILNALNGIIESQASIRRSLVTVVGRYAEIEPMLVRLTRAANRQEEALGFLKDEVGSLRSDMTTQFAGVLARLDEMEAKRERQFRETRESFLAARAGALTRRSAHP